MSNMLIDKRNELLARKNALIAERKAEIDRQVEAYRMAIEAQTSKEDIIKIGEVITALDAVIAYDSISEPIAQDVVVNAIDNSRITEQHVEARPGMTDIFTPSRG